MEAGVQLSIGAEMEAYVVQAAAASNCCQSREMSSRGRCQVGGDVKKGEMSGKGRCQAGRDVK